MSCARLIPELLLCELHALHLQTLANDMSQQQRSCSLLLRVPTAGAARQTEGMAGNVTTRESATVWQLVLQIDNFHLYFLFNIRGEKLKRDAGGGSRMVSLPFWDVSPAAAGWSFQTLN